MFCIVIIVTGVVYLILLSLNYYYYSVYIYYIYTPSLKAIERGFFGIFL